MDSFFLQRRYLVSFESRRLPHIFTDVLVIGGGVAGLRAAVEAAASGQVILLAKSKATESNSFYAQGGLAAVMDDQDSLQSHIADTLATACGLGNEEVIRLVIGQAPAAIHQMRQWGTAFDTADNSELALGREGGHSARRIVHARGDATGKVLSQTLLDRALATPGIKLFDNCFCIDLVTDPPGGGAGSTCIGPSRTTPVTACR